MSNSATTFAPPQQLEIRRERAVSAQDAARLVADFLDKSPAVHSAAAGVENQLRVIHARLLEDCGGPPPRAPRASADEDDDDDDEGDAAKKMKKKKKRKNAQEVKEEKEEENDKEKKKKKKRKKEK